METAFPGMLLLGDTGQHNSVRIRLITYAWGRSYIDRMLAHPIASALAPGNLPALAKEFACEVAIVTEGSEFEYLRHHPVVEQLEQICEVKLVSLDDLITEPWQYGITLAYALYRGMSTDLPASMTDMYFLFLNGDFVLADGSYERLIPHIRSGHRAILSPSYCANEEDVAQALASARSFDGSLTMAPRNMASQILRHRHNTIRAKTVSQGLVHFSYMDQVYWDVDDSTLLGMQMPISLVAMRPEVALDDIGAFWDWGIVYDFCPSRQLTVLGDSDEFLMLELRGASEHAGSIRVGAQYPSDAASRMLGYITQYQTDSARYLLTLHSKDLPDIAEPERKLRKYRDEMLSYLPRAPIDHEGHEQWTYHHGHLFRYPPTVRRELSGLRAQLRQLDARRATLHRQIDAITSAADAELDSAQPAVRAVAQALPTTSTLVGRIYRVIFGQLPEPRTWHPLYAPYRSARALLDRFRQSRSRVLVVCSPRAGLARAIPTLASGSLRLAAIEVLARASAADDGDRFDSCIVEWETGSREDPVDVLKAAAGLLADEGTLHVLIVNHGCARPEEWAHPLARALLELRTPGRVTSAGSWLGWGAMRLIRLVGRGARRGRLIAGLVVAGVLALAVPLALLALIVEVIAPFDAGRVRRNATSLRIDFSFGRTVS